MNRAVQIIGVPIDLGQSHRGVDLGPSTPATCQFRSANRYCTNNMKTTCRQFSMFAKQLV